MQTLEESKEEEKTQDEESVMSTEPASRMRQCIAWNSLQVNLLNKDEVHHDLKDVILLDTASMISLYSNPKLVNNI